MIRVIYRWRVDDDHREEFVRWWHDGTLRIRGTYDGAMGSTLCEPATPDGQFVGIARWRSQPDLTAFWQNPGGTEFPWAVMESSEILEELDHLSLEG